ncbi:MAG: acyl-CoA dehydrogenase [Bacteroidetes bacterium QH_2_63_10]|nr:MAG: acyl-CoA dehydrogenase [Bacteroidetes bacterium QH_2_63_10]
MAPSAPTETEASASSSATWDPEAFDAPDFYDLEGLLSEEATAVRDEVRAFVTEEVLPIIEEHAQRAEFPRPLIPAFAERGLLGPTIPPEHGGGGQSNVAYGLMMQELERGDSGLRSFCSVTGSLVMYPIWRYGTEAQKERWLPALANGEAIGCFGLTEPEVGSNPSALQTRARRTAVTSEVVLDAVRVPEAHRLPAAEGLKAPLSCLTQARYGICWGAIGAAMACYDAARQHARNREQFGQPIGGFQLMQERLVEMVQEITKAQLLNWRLGTLKDAGDMRPQQVSLAKRNNCETALDVAQSARKMLGGDGVTSRYPVMRHLNNLEAVSTYEGTHEVHTLVVGEDVTGLNAFA